MNGDQVIVGITGSAGSGKDVAAAGLEEMGFVKRSFATPIKAALNAMFGWQMEQWNDREWKEAPLDGLGKSPRQLAQTLGTEWGRDTVSPDIWVHALFAGASDLERLVIPDVRFDNETRAIRKRGGIVIKVARPGVAPVSAHSSESGVSPELLARIIMNDGTIDELMFEAQAAVVPLITPSTMDWPEEAVREASGEGGRQPEGGGGCAPSPWGEGRDHVHGRRRVPGLGGVDR